MLTPKSSQDAPQYTPAKITVLATQAAAAFISFVLFFYYVWANKRKGSLSVIAESGSVDRQTEEHLWEDQTDKQNPTFRYVY